MMKFVLFLMTMFFIPVQSQEIDALLNSIHTVKDAETFIELYPEWEAELINVIDVPYINNVEVGDIYNVSFESSDGTSQSYRAKVLDEKEATLFRVSYIALEATESLSLVEINSLRDSLIQKYQEGVSFIDLMDLSSGIAYKTEDTDWSFWEDYIPEFESEIPKYKLDDLFKLDIPRLNLYMVVLKTHEEHLRRISENIIIPVEN